MVRQDRRIDPEWVNVALVCALCFILLVVAGVVGGIREDVRLQGQRIEALEATP